MSETPATTTRSALAAAMPDIVEDASERVEKVGGFFEDRLVDALLDSAVLIDTAALATQIRDVATPIAQDGSLAYEYWRGYRAARNEVADLLRDPQLVQLPAERIDLEAELAKWAEGSDR